MRQFTAILLLLCFARVSFPQDIDKYDDYFKGIADIEYKDYNASAGYFTKALETNKNNCHILLMRGEAYYLLQNYQAAISDLIKAEETISGLASYRLATCYARLNKPEEAVKWLEVFLKSEYKCPESKIKLDKTFSCIENTTEWKKLWSNEWYNKQEQTLAEAEYLMNSRKYTEAMDVLDNLLDQRKRFHQGFYLRAKIFILMNDDKNALEDLNEAIDIYKKNLLYYSERADVNYRLGKFRQSLSDINSALELDPLNIKLYFEKSLTESKLKEYKKAVSGFELYLRYFDKDHEALYQTGICYFDMKNYDKAMEYFNTAIQYNRSIAKYYTGRAYTNAMKSEFINAEDDFSMALDLTPKDASIYYGRGMVRLYLNKNKDACRDFEKAANLGNNEAINQLEQNCK